MSLLPKLFLKISILIPLLTSSIVSTETVLTKYFPNLSINTQIGIFIINVILSMTVNILILEEYVKKRLQEEIKNESEKKR